MFRGIINKIVRDKALLEQASKAQKDAFTQGYALYKRITATAESKEAASAEEVKRAIDLLQKGKLVPEAGGDKGVYRKYVNDLVDVLDSKQSPKF